MASNAMPAFPQLQLGASALFPTALSLNPSHLATTLTNLAKVSKQMKFPNNPCCDVTEKPHLCDFPGCGKRFRQKPHLQAHKNIHSGRRFNCQWVGCGKSFVRKYNLVEHQKMHSPVQTNMCTYPECGKVFSSKYSLMPPQGPPPPLPQPPPPPPPPTLQSQTSTVSIPPALSLPSTSTAKQTTTFGHDRQPSVQLKIEASGGPPLLSKASFGERAQRHLRLFFGGLFAILSRLSPVVQSISALLILIYLVQFSGDVVVDFFALTPGEFISPGQWYHTIISLWSHAFLETRIYSLIVDLLILFFCSSLIEPLWGHREVIRFLAIACLPSALLTAIHYILLYCITYDVAYLFSVRIHGFLPFCAAVVVTVKQLLPQSILFSTSFGRLKNDDIPLTVLVILVVLYFCNILYGVQVLMFTYGILSSWFYLRFLQPHTRHSISTLSSSSTTTTITRGDLSDSFAFETFFPNVLRPVVAVISNAVYIFLVRLHICPKIPSPAVRLLEEQSSQMPSTSKSFKYYPQNSVYYNKQTSSKMSESVQPLLSSSVEDL
ncbi:hypothetical protein TYRP_010830 [Tyrophagus putrescentiae]|nr:hypothetical protein TYRP_010830 [Tyrophagus putrescentiae]